MAAVGQKLQLQSPRQTALLQSSALQRDLAVVGREMNERTARADIRVQPPGPDLAGHGNGEVRLDAPGGRLGLDVRRETRWRGQGNATVVGTDFQLPSVPDRARQLHLNSAIMSIAAHISGYAL